MKKQCPNCKRVTYRSDDYYCVACNYPLIEVQEQQQQQAPPKYVPRCPTCQSEDIKKISTAAKIGGAATLGLFSKTARSQFQCNNCGYKW